MNEQIRKSYIVSIETSGSTCGVALSQNSEILAQYSAYGRNLHDRLNAEYIRRILNDNELTIDDIDAVAVSSGPGSFTGLRIGGSIAKGLCYENKPVLIAVPTLKAFAFAASEVAINSGAKTIIASVPSHKNLCYIQEFDVNANELSEIQFVETDVLFNKSTEDAFFCGSLVPTGEKVMTMKALQTHSPVFIAALAYQYFLEGKFIQSEEYTPDYAQEFEPKTKQSK